MGRTVMLNGQELWLLLEEALPVMGKGVIWTLYLSAMAILLPRPAPGE